VFEAAAWVLRGVVTVKWVVCIVGGAVVLLGLTRLWLGRGRPQAEMAASFACSALALGLVLLERHLRRGRGPS
jgi:hypothetical protein